MDIKEMQKMAGIEVVNEDAGSVIPQFGRRIFEMAEANAYNRNAESRGGVTHDEIAEEAKRILSMIEQNIMERISADFYDGREQDDEIK